MQESDPSPSQQAPNGADLAMALPDNLGVSKNPGRLMWTQNGRMPDRRTKIKSPNLWKLSIFVFFKKQPGASACTAGHFLASLLDEMANNPPQQARCVGGDRIQKHF